MEAIKKKMASIKIDKDNAMDRADVAEAQLRDVNQRVAKVGTDPILIRVLSLSIMSSI